ncbi:MAG: SURF1 family protein [Betaproteobacteria bacterium]|nr:SURF1 family protein [Betaproteobacteria bacterium]
MHGKSRFRPGLWPTLAAAAGIAVTLALGNWQLGRGHEKAELAARIEQLAREPAINVSARELDARDVELRRVEAHGTFEPKYMVLIDNRVRHGVVGYHVVMPLKLGDGSRYVLVNRGWVAGSRDRSRLPEVNTPREALVVRGRAVVPGRRFLELSTKFAEGQVWQNLTLGRYREAVPIPIQPFLIQQENEDAPDDGLIREWEAPDLGVDKHYGYAFQWFALSGLILIFYLITHVRRKRET